jgi:hypothetical protein
MERYARTSQPAVSRRHPTRALLVLLWLLLVLALAVVGAWLTVAWRYVAA